MPRAVGVRLGDQHGGLAKCQRPGKWHVWYVAQHKRVPDRSGVWRPFGQRRPDTHLWWSRGARSAAASVPPQAPSVPDAAPRSPRGRVDPNSPPVSRRGTRPGPDGSSHSVKDSDPTPEVKKRSRHHAGIGRDYTVPILHHVIRLKKNE